MAEVAGASLYRALLKAARIYPSKNRSRIISDIKEGFRANRSLTDPSKIKAELEEARQGLKMMRQMNEMVGGRSPNWSVTIGAE